MSTVTVILGLYELRKLARRSSGFSVALYVIFLQNSFPDGGMIPGTGGEGFTDIETASDSVVQFDARLFDMDTE